MNLKKYQIASKRTMASLGNEDLDIIHCVLGMTSEIEEFFESVENEDDVNIQEECVDILFYLVNYATFRGYDCETIEKNFITFEDEDLGGYLLKSISGFANLIKRLIAYKKPINTELEFDLICRVYHSIKQMFDSVEYNLGQALQNNVDKLLVRYPLAEGFSTERANSRDLESERKELEK